MGQTVVRDGKLLKYTKKDRKYFKNAHSVEKHGNRRLLLDKAYKLCYTSIKRCMRNTTVKTVTKIERTMRQKTARRKEYGEV